MSSWHTDPASTCTASKTFLKSFFLFRIPFSFFCSFLHQDLKCMRRCLSLSNISSHLSLMYSVLSVHYSFCEISWCQWKFISLCNKFNSCEHKIQGQISLAEPRTFICQITTLFTTSNSLLTLFKSTLHDYISFQM